MKNWQKIKKKDIDLWVAIIYNIIKSRKGRNGNRTNKTR